MKIRINNSLLIAAISLSLFSLLLFSPIYAENITYTYDFDEVEVEYAAEFTAKPGNANLDPDSFIAKIAGDSSKPITVLYGVVHLKKGGELQLSEEFIKVIGTEGSERFLMNSGTYNYYDYTDENTSDFKDIRTLFWSAKKLVDTSVVKDFTLPINSIILFREFNEDQSLNSIILSFVSGDKGVAGEEFDFGPTKNVYEADMTTLNQSGNPTASAK